MTPKQPSVLPLEMWEQLPVALQAVVGATGEHYEQRIAVLEAQVRELTVRLHQTSQNSSKPPSSDGPHVRRKPPKPPSGRKKTFLKLQLAELFWFMALLVNAG